MFAYCGNSPVNAWDYNGHRAVFEFEDEQSSNTTLSYTNGPIRITETSDSITIDANLAFMDPTVSDMLIEGIKQYWEGTYVIDGKKKTVTVNIHHTVQEYIPVYTKNTSGRSYTTSNGTTKQPISVTVFLDYVGDDIKHSQWAMAHEFGHCLMIGDYYVHVDAGEAGYYMSNRSIMNAWWNHAYRKDIEMAMVAARTQSWQEWEANE